MYIASAAGDSSLDNDFLQYMSGINDNSIKNIIDPDTDEDNVLNCPQIITHSSYFVFVSIILYSTKYSTPRIYRVDVTNST